MSNITVEELIEKLQKLPKELIVGSCDSEWGFYPITTVAIKTVEGINTLGMNLPKGSKFVGISNWD
jgi:hypothetical protein